MEKVQIESSIAGGHESRFQLDESSEDDSILIKKTNENELNAYVKVFSEDSSNPRYVADQAFRKFIPLYYG